MTPDRVLDTIEAVVVRPWNCAAGLHCIGDAGGVFRLLWGIDPVAGLRGRCTTPRGAMRVVAGAGGMDAMLQAEFAASGLVCGVGPGAIGIGTTYEAAFGGLCAVICIEPGVWAGKSRGGFVVSKMSVGGWLCQD